MDIPYKGMCYREYFFLVLYSEVNIGTMKSIQNIDHNDLLTPIEETSLKFNKDISFNKKLTKKRKCF
jgi:hypothetical protein